MCPSSSGDRASASGAESRRFESYLGHHSDFPRTRMMRVFFFRQEIAAASLPSPNTPQRYRTKKRARMRTRLGGACIPSAQCIVANHTQLTRAAVSAAFVFRRICDDSHRHAPEPTKATALKRHQATSSDRLISRNGLQQAAWRCSQSHRRRTRCRAPRQRCSRD